MGRFFEDIFDTTELMIINYTCFRENRLISRERARPSSSINVKLTYFPAAAQYAIQTGPSSACLEN